MTSEKGGCDLLKGMKAAIIIPQFGTHQLQLELSKSQYVTPFMAVFDIVPSFFNVSNQVRYCGKRGERRGVCRSFNFSKFL